MPIEIKQITAQETYKLRHEVMWPDMPLEFVKLKNDAAGVHFGVFKDLEIISVVSLFIKDNRAQFRKLATKTSEQGQGYGSVLLDHLISYVTTKRHINWLWCNARADKTSFYKKFGMIATKQTFQKEGLDYCIMEKKLSI